jgi:hypothetical protein
MPVLSARAGATHKGAKPRWILTLVAIAGACLTLLSGCMATGPAPSLAAAADPQVRVPPTRYNSVTAPYTPQRPVEPTPWRERNERVAPQASP